MPDQTTNHSVGSEDFRVGDWLVQPRLNRVSGQLGSEKLEPRIMAALVFLAGHAGMTVTRDQLVEQLWDGAHVTEDALNRSISKLRKVFGDDPKNPAVIETIPKVGYRLIAPVVIESPRAKTPAHSNAQLPDTTVAAAPMPLEATGVASPRRFPLWALCLGLLLAVGIALPWFWRRQSGKTVQTINLPAARVAPFTSYPGLEILPAISPDGSHVAFAWKGAAQDNWDIYIKQVETEPPFRLTSHPHSDLNPAWSPDGRLIAFARKSKTECGIYTVTPHGQSERKLTGCHEESNLALSWSPDGKWLAYTDKTALYAPEAGFLLSLETGEKRRLTSPPADWLFGDSEIAFAPDGKTLAFARYSALGVADIYLTPIVGGEPKRLTFDNLKVHGLAWTPDGRSIIYSSNRGGSFGLWRIPAVGGEPERVATDGRSAEQPAIAPRGRLLVYEQWADQTNIWKVALAPGREPALAPVTASTRWDEYPQYSPDGQRIAFVSDRSGSAEIWVCQSDGSASVRLTSFNGPYTRAPRWSPDGSRIAFDTSADGNFDVYVVIAAGGTPRRLMTDASEEHIAGWSRDGRWLYFTSNRTGSWQIWKVKAEGGEATQVTSNGGFAAAESLDGEWLYFTHRGKAGLWRLPIAGGNEEMALEQLQPLDWLNWTLTRTGIYFIARPAPGVAQLAFFDLNTRRVRSIRPLPKFLYKSGLSVTPDGGTLLYARVEKSEADLILVDNFSGNGSEH
ncbi:MAG: winged helix-turn-helix domain-containing protein [Acidobacteria bacterium]|nr:winged helix-turn-helix domain-containing protein [Acidobacteriota bacterium]